MVVSFIGGGNRSSFLGGGFGRKGKNYHSVNKVNQKNIENFTS
jgi:hypothetical protein